AQIDFLGRMVQKLDFRTTIGWIIESIMPHYIIGQIIYIYKPDPTHYNGRFDISGHKFVNFHIFDDIIHESGAFSAPIWVRPLSSPIYCFSVAEGF
ncbi:hypothetical protein ACJX0J_014583, partial [Zea mays]